MNAVENVKRKQSKTLYIVGKNVKWCSHYGNQYGDSLQLKIDLPYEPLVLLLGTYPQE